MTLKFLYTDTGEDFSWFFDTCRLFYLSTSIPTQTLSSPSAARRRESIGVVEEHEEMISYVAAGNRDAFLEGVKERQGDEN